MDEKKWIDEFARTSVALAAALDEHAKVLVEGTPDPLWPDGVRANQLLHVIALHRARLLALVEEHGLSAPSVLEKPVPGRVPYDFMAAGRLASNDFVPLTAA
jgi:hypothetical protein